MSITIFAFLTACEKSDINPAPKIVINKPVTNYPNRYWDFKVPVDIIASDNDGLSSVNVTVTGGGGVLYSSGSGPISQKEYALNTTFKADTLYGKSPLKSTITVEATDAKGALSRQSVEFDIYKH